MAAPYTGILRIFLLALLLLFVDFKLVAAPFSESPVSREVTVGTAAVFRCQCPTADTVRWRVNGSLVDRRRPPPGVTPNITTEDGNLVDTLTIVARPEYNETVVVCVARFRDGTPDETCTSAVLLIRGDSNGTALGHEGFTKGPYSVNVTAGEIVDFGCVHQFLDVEWEVNGNILSGGHFPPSVSVASHSLGGDDFRHVLTVTASIDNDDTTFACVLEDDPSIRSEVAVLRVQGPLDAPSHLNSSSNYTTNTITITWTPPPSIDLTNITIDIVYCIEVENMTCGERGDVIVSECGITEPIYQSTDIPLNYIYNITVTPMSNVEGALNGTPAHLEEEFPTLNEITSVFTSLDGTVNAMVTMDITGRRNMPLPSFCSLSLTPFGASNSTLKPATDIVTNDSIVLYVNGLEEQMLLNCLVVAYTCDTHPLTIESVLNTHYAQHILVSSPAPGEITVTGDFLNSSTTTGLLVIAYTSSSNVRYHLYSRTPNEQNFRTVINNLEAGDYHVSVFTVENGLPFRQVATLPQRVSVTSTESVDSGIQAAIDYELLPTSTGVCITCTFLESSTATDCVAVVHQQISQLNSSAGLMNIESSHKFTRSGDTASGCIEGVNLRDRQVVVLQGVLEPSVTTNSLSTTTVAVSVVTVAIIAAITVLLVVVIYMKRNWRKSSLERPRNVEVVSVNSYESVSALPSTNYVAPVSALQSSSRVASDGEEDTAMESAPPSYDSAIFVSSPTNDRPTEEDEGYAGDATYSVPDVPRPAANIKHEKVNGDEYAVVSKPAKVADASTDETALGTVIYAEPDVKPQEVSVPLDDDRFRVGYAEVNKTEGTKGQQYEMVSHPTSKPIMVVDDTSKTEFGYSELRHQCDSTEVTVDKPKPVVPVSCQERPPPLPTCCTVDTLPPLLCFLSPEWRELAKALSLDEDHIDEIYTNNMTDEACLKVVVERYFMNGDFKHTWKEIVSVLRDIKCEQVADSIYNLHVYPYEVPLPGEAQTEMMMVDKDLHNGNSDGTSSSVVDQRDGHQLRAPVQQESTDLFHQGVFVHNSSNNPTPLRRPNADSKPLSHLGDKEGESKVNDDTFHDPERSQNHTSGIQERPIAASTPIKQQNSLLLKPTPGASNKSDSAYDTLSVDSDHDTRQEVVDETVEGGATNTVQTQLFIANSLAKVPRDRESEESASPCLTVDVPEEGLDSDLESSLKPFSHHMVFEAEHVTQSMGLTECTNITPDST